MTPARRSTLWLLSLLFLQQVHADARGSNITEYIESLPSDDASVFVTEAERLGSAATPVLINLLERPGNLKQHVCAIRALGRIGDPTCVKAIRRALASASEKDLPSLEWYVPEAMARIGNADAVRLLLDISRNPRMEDAAFVQQVLPQSISMVTNRTAAGAFIEELQRKDGLHVIAMEKLGEIGDEHVASRIARFLKDERPELRRTTASALSRIGNTNAIPFLSEALDRETETMIKVHIAGALARLGDKRGKTMTKALSCKGDVQERCRAIEFSVNTPDDFDEKHFASLACESDLAIRKSVVLAVGKFTNACAAAFLEKVMIGDDEQTIRQLAREAFMRIKAADSRQPDGVP